MIASGSLNLSNIVMAQAGNSGLFDWFLLPLFPLFVVYWVSGVAETNRAPFDVVTQVDDLLGPLWEAESTLLCKGVKLPGDVPQTTTPAPTALTELDGSAAPP